MDKFREQNITIVSWQLEVMMNKLSSFVGLIPFGLMLVACTEVSYVSKERADWFTTNVFESSFIKHQTMRLRANPYSEECSSWAHLRPSTRSRSSGELVCRDNSRSSHAVSDYHHCVSSKVQANCESSETCNSDHPDPMDKVERSRVRIQIIFRRNQHLGHLLKLRSLNPNLFLH